MSPRWGLGVWVLSTFYKHVAPLGLKNLTGAVRNRTYRGGMNAVRNRTYPNNLPQFIGGDRDRGTKVSICF